jgi:hypothetical protein
MARSAAVIGASLMAGALGVLVAVTGAGAEVRFSFVSPPARPASGVPSDARDAGTEPDPDAGHDGTANIRFRIVRDIRDHGALSALAAPRIAAVTVTWTDPALLTTNRETEAFLQRLLTVAQGSTYTHVPWAQALGLPSVVATIEHTDGRRGSWHVWYGWPSVYCVYRDGDGAWWFGHWFHVDPLRLP